MPMLPPQLAMMQPPGGPAKPLFPSAVPSSSPGGSAIVGADFKPITTGYTQILHSDNFFLVNHVIIFKNK